MNAATDRRSDESTAATDTVWRDSELVNPHVSESKAGKVRSMFAAIAASYDLNNRLHSLWFDQAWRRHAVRAAAVRRGETVLDVACGTGDLTEAFAARSPAGEVIGVDFTPEMLGVARTKQATRRPEIAGRIRYEHGDAMDLHLPDASADVVSIAFGIRNVQEPERAIAEFSRVLRPGGRLVILEFDTPRFAPVRWFNTWYAGWLMPRTATLISGDQSGAYRYLPRSVESFMPRERLLESISRAGFTDAKARPLTMGICMCYRAIRSGA
ncbi:MAG: bifunctional demethylmenaquinone methyltransferase/2-methoxy-6-polyprenyl-1,4-benzoquinol methylase UbiE [Phycisphaerales bacterium]|nr:bifunctional demethylmenaquinone methyltransferase/2-methoxy-6-polyprenyl-1,4-benzoquinol methylase UbiE [Phycisphaerales bacterium]